MDGYSQASTSEVQKANSAPLGVLTIKVSRESSSQVVALVQVQALH